MTNVYASLNSREYSGTIDKWQFGEIEVSKNFQKKKKSEFLEKFKFLELEIRRIGFLTVNCKFFMYATLVVLAKLVGAK